MTQRNEIKKRVLYMPFQDIHLRVIDGLLDKHGWEPVFLFSCTEKARAWAKEKSPDALMHDEMAMRQAQFDYLRIWPPVPIDAKILGVLSKFEFNCLMQMEDTTGWNFSYEERSRYYYDLLQYWNTLIHRVKPDLMVAFNWPHTVTAYSLYLLCKHHYDIDVLFLDAMPLLNKNFHVIGVSLEDPSMPFKRLYESDESLDIGPDVKEYLSERRAEEWMMAKHNSEDLAKWAKRASFQFRNFSRIIFYMIMGKVFQDAHLAFKKNNKPFESSKSRLTHFDYFWFRDDLRRKDMGLESVYTSFCIEPDFKRKYVYFASALQPETTTDIFGGIYTDQVLTVEVLSSSIPKDWIIYYKEHPACFHPMVKGSLRRNRHYYEKVRNLGNVQIVSHKTDQFKLIDNAQVVASVTGSSTWEAVVRGKPGLFFGNTWYQSCRSVFKVNTLQDCQEAIDKVVNGYEPDQEDVERYLAAVDHVVVKNVHHYNFAENIKNSHNLQYEMERIANAFYDAYAQYYRHKDQLSTGSLN